MRILAMKKKWKYPGQKCLSKIQKSHRSVFFLDWRKLKKYTKKTIKHYTHTHNSFMSDTKHFLLGVWKNQLGSNMFVEEVNESGFSGTYSTAVSGNDTALTQKFRGTINMVNETTKEAIVAFSVNWAFQGKDGKPIRSTTAWCGTVRNDTINAQWLLVRYQDAAHEWNSTNIGSDHFYKLS